MIKMLQAGAQDYLIKEQITTPLLVRVMQYAIERQRLRESLHENSMFFRLITDNVTDLIAVLDRDGRRLYNSPSYEALLGNPDQLIGSNSLTDVHPEDVERVRSIFQQTVETGVGQRTEYRLCTHDGEIRYIESQGNVVPDGAGRAAKVVVVSRDITERKQAEQELRESEERLQAILDQTPSVVYLKDLEGRYLYINSQFERVFHVDRRDAIGQTDLGLFPENLARRFREHDKRILRLGKPQCSDEEAPHDDGPHNYISVKFPIFDPAGRPYAVCGIATDITDRKKAEKELQAKNLALQRANEALAAARLQLIQAERLKSIGTLAAGVAHEVKNPLQILLLGMNDLAGSLPKLDEDLELTLKDMREAVDRAAGIVRSLLNFSRMQELELEPADLGDVIRSALKLVRFKLTDAHIRVDRELDPKLRPVMIDQQKMQQVLINLMNNAIDVMPDGGRLGLRTYGRMCLALEPHAGLGDTTLWRPGESLAVVEITDTGPGIAPELLPRVFDPFVTTKPSGKGDGLGLAVVQNIIALHGGAIDLENRPEGGVRVCITLKTQTPASP